MADFYSLSLPVARMPEWEEPSPLTVQPGSEWRLRKHVERFALHFMREMHFDYPQFAASENPDTLGYEPYQAFLFHALARDLLKVDEPAKRRFFGAGCFRWRAAGWELDWVWLHPYFRNRGMLRREWPRFRERYGEFRVARPMSPAMEAFLKTSI